MAMRDFAILREYSDFHGSKWVGNRTRANETSRLGILNFHRTGENLSRDTLLERVVDRAIVIRE